MYPVVFSESTVNLHVVESDVETECKRFHMDMRGKKEVERINFFPIGSRVFVSPEFHVFFKYLNRFYNSRGISSHNRFYIYNAVKSAFWLKFKQRVIK